MLVPQRYRLRSTYDLMFGSVLLRHFVSLLTYVLLECGVDDQFLSDGVPGELPGELVLPASCLVKVLCVEDILVVLLDLTVILLDRI